MSGLGCWECSQKNGHAATGGVHPPWHCRPDECPDRDKHAAQVYGPRLTERYGAIVRDAGVNVIKQIDGVDASKHYEQKRCICGLLLIWEPKSGVSP